MLTLYNWPISSDFFRFSFKKLQSMKYIELKPLLRDKGLLSFKHSASFVTHLGYISKIYKLPMDDIRPDIRLSTTEGKVPPPAPP